MSDEVYQTCADRLDSPKDDPDTTCADVLDEVSCTICGCTENDPCTGGCQWVPGLPFDICDQCVIRMQRVLVAAAALRRHQRTRLGAPHSGLSHHLTTVELKRELDAALGDCGVA